MATQGTLRASPPIYLQPTPPSRPPPIRVLVPKSGPGTNSGTRPQNP